MSNILHRQGERGDVLAHVASNLKRIRVASGMSQAALSQASGVSRRMIISLEGGDANIGISNLEKLSDALGVSLAAMIADPNTCKERIDAVTWRGSQDSSMGLLRASIPAVRETQLWEWSIAPGERYPADPDPQGWRQIIIVSEGELRLEKADGNATVKAGDFLIYDSCQSYAYINEGGVVVRFVSLGVF